MPISTLRVFSLALLVASQFLSSQGNGTSVYNFLAREYSPRSAALAGNSGLYGGDVDVLLSNPGALVSVENTQISAAYSRLFMDFSSAFIAYVSTPGQYGSFAVSLIYFDYGSFAETDVLGVSHRFLFFLPVNPRFCSATQKPLKRISVLASMAK
jgi:hypothetical protein